MICMSARSIALSMLGMLSPASRGSLTTAAILLFCFFGYGAKEEGKGSRSAPALRWRWAKLMLCSWCCLCRVIGGYYGGRLYKTLKGTNWKQAAMTSGILFPSVVFGVAFFLNFFIWGQASSGAVPFTTMIALALLWVGIALPLVMVGYFFGYRKEVRSGTHTPANLAASSRMTSARAFRAVMRGDVRGNWCRHTTTLCTRTRSRARCQSSCGI
jgi:transmembrane 9 superfamily protein 2/4